MLIALSRTHRLIWTLSMLGSLTFYRRILNDNWFSNPSFLVFNRASKRKLDTASEQVATKLPTFGHAIAGVMAGATVSFIAAPVEHIKARLQIQYAVDKSQRLYSGPIDCIRRIVGVISKALQELGIDLYVLVSSAWRTWCIPWLIRHSSFPLLLFLLVGLVRFIHTLFLDIYQPLNPCNKFLGRRPLSAGLLADFLSFRCHQAENYDRSVGWLSWRWRKAISAMEGCSEGDMEKRWAARVLEGLCALFSTSFSCKRNGFTGV